MRRAITVAAVVACAGLFGVPLSHGASPPASVAALQVALRSHGMYAGEIDGVEGPLTRAGIVALQKQRGLAPSGAFNSRTRRALGPLGRPLLGQRELWQGLRGWDVAALEFRLVRFGLPLKAVDGRFSRPTVAALRRFQRAHGLQPDGIAGTRTYRALAQATSPAPTPLRIHVVQQGEGFFVIADRYGIEAEALAAANGLTLSSVLNPAQGLRLPGMAAQAPPGVEPPRVHVVAAGDSWFAIAQRYRVSPFDLAEENTKTLDYVIVPGQRLRLPIGAAASPGSAQTTATRDEVRAHLDRWAREYGVDPRLARALAWMESGFQQHVVSNVGALGVMQLLPETWDWVDSYLLGQATPRTADGNVRAGVRYLRWQLDQFGDDVELALAGWYQGARAVREIGLYDDTKVFVSVVRQLYGQV